MITTADKAYRSLRDIVVSGELKPGQRISQLKLARRFRCSTPPVVEAMRRLESEGLLVKTPRKMALVRELSKSDLEGLYMVREGLEAVTARLCAQRISQEQLEQLRLLNQAYESATTGQSDAGNGKFDIAIHKLIADASQCKLVAEELDRLLLIERTAGRNLHSNPASPLAHSAHRALIQAIADRDSDSAEYLMKKHIQSGYHDVVNAPTKE